MNKVFYEVIEVTEDGNERVMAGPFDTEQEARQVRDEVQDDMGESVIKCRHNTAYEK